MKRFAAITLSALFVSAGLSSLFWYPAYADLGYTAGAGTTIFDFVCFVSKHCSAHVPIDSTGADMTDTTNHALNIGSVAGTTFGAQADTACSTDNGTCSLIQLLKRTNQNVTTLNTTAGSAIPAGTNVIGYVSTDPCNQQNVAKANVAISMTGTTTVKLVSLVAAKKIYVCSFSVIASGATVFSLADGTKVTTECDTSAEAVIGATTATHGLSLAANGGLTYGNGTGTVAFTTTAAHDLCLFQSGAGDISGNLTYVQQ